MNDNFAALQDKTLTVEEKIVIHVQIGEKPEILVVRLRMIKGHNNKFYVHDIFNILTVKG